MTTPQDNFDSIRALLNRYYDGLTSPEENQRLQSFFSAADSGALPEDLAEEAALFAVMKHGEDFLAASAPDYLEENLRAIMAGEVYVKPRRSKLIRFVARFAAAAAVAALLITVGVRVNGPVDMADPTSAEEAMLTLVLPPAPIEEPVVAVVEESKPLLASATADRPAQHVFVPVSTPDINDMPDNYIEITDMNQACMLAQDAFALVREKLAVASYSLSSASDGIRQIEYAMCETIIN